MNDFLAVCAMFGLMFFAFGALYVICKLYDWYNELREPARQRRRQQELRARMDARIAMGRKQ
jgi:hypothetical protein